MRSLRIKNETPIQENFIGNGAVYHGYAGMPDGAGRVYTPEQCEEEADRAGKMRLKLARTFYGWYAWEPATGTWNWENARCRAFYAWLDRMQKRNIKVALQAGWCCPGDVNSTCWNGVSPFHVEGDWTASVARYADWVSESVHQLIEVRGFTNITVLVLFTEPQRPSGKLPEGVAQYEAWHQCVRAVISALERDGRRHLVQLMGPNEGSTYTSQMLHWVAEQDPDCVDIYSSHAYQNTPDTPRALIQSGICAPAATVPGGRIFQKVTLKPHTRYTVSSTLLLKAENPMRVSGCMLIGAFDVSDGTVNAGGQMTNRLTRDSVRMLDAAALTSEYRDYTVSFDSGEHTEAYIGSYYDVKYGEVAYIEHMGLFEEGSDENLLKNHDFSAYYDHWSTLACGGSGDIYYEWQKWCRTGVDFIPKGKMFIYDEYNSVQDRNNARRDHGSNIVLDAIAFMNCGVNGSLLWTVFDQIWPNNHTTNNDSFVDGDHRCGTMPVLTRTRVPHLSYYAFSLLSRYTGGEGCHVYEGVGEQNTHLTMCRMADGHTTVVVVNNKDRAETFTVRFDKPLNLTLNRHTFDPDTLIPDERAEILPIDGTVTVGDVFTDTLPAYGVKVYTTYED